MILYAVNIHGGGGKILLDELLLNSPLGQVSIAFIDQRYTPPTDTESRIQLIRVKPNLFSRWKAEILLKKVASSNLNKDVLCFGNLPPAFNLKNNTILFLQNAFILPGVRVSFDNLRAFLRNHYDKLWFLLFSHNVDSIYVQTKWMKEYLGRKAIYRTPILLKPFLPQFPRIDTNLKKYDFISITSNHKHKHLKELLKGIALSEAKAANFFIVIESISNEVNIMIQKLKKDGFNIEVASNFSREELLLTVSQSRNLIITSELESFCLPLHEGLHYKLDIISGDYPFITEYTKPSELIDPNSPKSIAAAIRKSLIKKEFKT